MEQPDSFFKNSRKQKRKEDAYKKGQQRSHNDGSNKETLSKSNKEAKPQRTNRRQRAEVTPVIVETDNKVNTLSEEKIESPATDDRVDTEETTINHGHLKRETEEIDKLTHKNYQRRQVTSNWERYSVPTTDDTDSVDDGILANDFATLLQIPQSLGGHLQLKEEKNWEMASETVLDSYLALDLILLAQGLACIPFYQRHQLPVDLFSKEDLEKMDGAAKQSEGIYKFKNDINSQLQRTKLNENVIKILSHKTEPQLNVLESIIISANKIGTNIEVENEEDASDENNDEEVNLSDKIEDIIEIPLISEIDSSTKHVNNINDVCKLWLNNDKTTEHRNLENASTPNMVLEKSFIVSKEVEDANTSKNNGNEVMKTVNQQSIEINNSEVKPVIKSSQLDGDEELDFLLSLKQPLKKHIDNTEPRKVTTDASVVGNSYNVECFEKTKVAAPIQRNELDDWLDSVLDD